MDSELCDSVAEAFVQVSPGPSLFSVFGASLLAKALVQLMRQSASRPRAKSTSACP